MKFGIYRPDGLLDERSISIIEEEIDAPITFLSFFRAWNHCSIEDDTHWLDAVLSSQREVLLSWEPWLIPADPVKPHNQPQFALKEILSGRYDSYISAVASSIRDCARAVYLRPMHEMNGFWYPWCGTVNGNSPHEFIQTWHHVRAIFGATGAHNVKWVWSPYTTSHPTTSENSIETYFPGDDAVDLTALDGYNWGISTEWGQWQEFADIFAHGYKTLERISTKPIIIGETGCSEAGGNKAKWIQEMYHQLRTRFIRIESLLWFDVDKECDWRIASSPEALAAFRNNAGTTFKLTK